MTAKQYSQIVGVVLVVVGIIGFIVSKLGPLQFHLHHNLVHLISGVVLAYLGFKGTESAQRLGCQVFGIVYGIVTIWGFLGKADFLFLTLHLNMAYNVIHLVVSGLALWAGFGKRPTAATA